MVGIWIMNFSKGLLGVVVTAALLADTPSAHAVTWATSNLNSSNMVVAYSPDYPNQVANAAAYWNNLAGTTVVGVTTDPSAASVTIKDVPVPDGDNTPNLALTFAPTGETDIYQQRITEQGADLQTVITHELGHSLGLDHDPAQPWWHHQTVILVGKRMITRRWRQTWPVMVVKSTIRHLMVNRHHKLLAQLHQQVALLAPHLKQVPRRQHPKHHHIRRRVKQLVQHVMKLVHKQSNLQQLKRHPINLRRLMPRYQQ